MSRISCDALQGTFKAGRLRQMLQSRLDSGRIGVDELFEIRPARPWLGRGANFLIGWAFGSMVAIVIGLLFF